MYKVKVNDKFDFKLDFRNNEIQVNEKKVDIDLAKVNPTQYHFLHNNKSYNVEIASINKEEKKAEIIVNGNSYQVDIKDQYDELLTKLGMDNLTSSKVLLIKAPMPGLVLNVLKAEGDEVAKGENILVLEAMKMENMIKSPTEGVIHKIEVKIGDKVDKNQILIKFA